MSKNGKFFPAKNISKNLTLVPGLMMNGNLGGSASYGPRSTDLVFATFNQDSR
jgi:hypothetical protein